MNLSTPSIVEHKGHFFEVVGILNLQKVAHSSDDVIITTKLATRAPSSLWGKGCSVRVWNQN